MLSITTIRCGPEISCFPLTAIPRLDEVSLWALFTKAGRKFRILSKLNSSLKPLLKNLCLISDLHAFSLPYYIDSLHFYYMHPPHPQYIHPPHPYLTCPPHPYATHPPHIYYMHPPHPYYTHRPHPYYIRPPHPYYLSRDPCTTLLPTCMKPRNPGRTEVKFHLCQGWMSDKKTCSHAPQWFTPTPIPNDNVRRSIRIHYTFMHSRQRHGQPLSTSALDPAMQISPFAGPCHHPASPTSFYFNYFLPAGGYGWMLSLIDKGRISDLPSPGFKSLVHYFLVLCLNINVLIPKVLWKD